MTFVWLERVDDAVASALEPAKPDRTGQRRPADREPRRRPERRFAFLLGSAFLPARSVMFSVGYDRV